MEKAVVVDKDYGSVSEEELQTIGSAYAKAGIELVSLQLSTEEEIVECCWDATAILGTGNPPITRAVMEALPKLKFIQRFGIGVNSIDLKAAADLNKIVLNLPGFCIKELADMAAAMILSLLRNTVYYDREIRKGNWPKCQYFLPGDVREMVLGLYGFGGAAKCLYEILHKGFGTKIIAYDPYITQEAATSFNVQFVSFEQLLEQSDIISLHAPLTPETKHCFNKEAFRKMKNTSMIINTARGGLINQEDLIWALNTGEIRYAGLDTFEQEPLEEDSMLRKMDSVILSPHSGSYGISAKRTQIEMVSRLLPDAVIKHEIPAAYVANRRFMENDGLYKFI